MTINSNILINNGTATMPNWFVWTQQSNDNYFNGGSKDSIMLSSDIVLVWGFEGKIDKDTKSVEREIIFDTPCSFSQ